MRSRSRTVAMLEKWVNQNSGTMNFAGVKAVATWSARNWYRSVSRSSGSTSARPTARATSWHGIKAGRAARKMLLIGHLDTVFEPESPFQRWVRRGNDGGIGPGGDNKGGVAVMVAALRAMKAAGALKDADITVFLTGDEEDAGTRSRSLAAAAHRRGAPRRCGAGFRRAGAA